LWEGWGQAAAAVAAVAAVFAAGQLFQDRPNGEVVIPLEHQGVWVGLQRECSPLVERVNTTTGLLVLVRREGSTQVATSVVDEFPVINLVVRLRRSTKLQEDEDLEVEGLDAHVHAQHLLLLHLRLLLLLLRLGLSPDLEE
jgi:hypothetical protein